MVEKANEVDAGEAYPIKIDPETIQGALKSTDRQAGRTTAMLTVAAQFADFGVPQVVIIAHNCRLAKTMADMFGRVLEALGFEREWDRLSRGPSTWRVRDTVFEFVSKSSRSWDYDHEGSHAVFWDHHRGDLDYGNINNGI